jgi:rubredoxin
MGSMNKRQCLVCGHVYDPTKGDPARSVPPGTVFENLPDEWVCPECGAEKDQYEDL